MNDIKKNPLLFKALSQHKFNQKLKKSIYKNVNKKGKRKKNDIESVPFSGQVISLNNEVIHKAVVIFWNTNSGVITIGFNYENYRFSSFDKVLKFKWDNGFDFKSKLFSEGISDNNKNIEEDIENIIGFLSKKFLSKIIEK